MPTVITRLILTLPAVSPPPSTFDTSPHPNLSKLTFQQPQPKSKFGVQSEVCSPQVPAYRPVPSLPVQLVSDAPLDMLLLAHQRRNTQCVRGRNLILRHNLGRTYRLAVPEVDLSVRVELQRRFVERALTLFQGVDYLVEAAFGIGDEGLEHDFKVLQRDHV